MRKLKKVTSVLLIAILSLGLSVPISAEAYTYTPGITYYTVVKGDSLYIIRQVFYTNVDSLMKLNGLKSISLDVGQVLKVPGDTYTVQKGDTLFLIAMKYKMPLAELRRANNIYSDYLDIGQRLAVPLPKAPQAAPVKQPASVPCSAEELDLLARLIMAETQTEPYQAKVAVGAVVINRVESGLFADTIKGVINQNINGYYQFTPVANGRINNPANADSINAAKEAVAGADPTGGALWYSTTTAQSVHACKKSLR
jgi:LysM repeat protein